MTAPIRIIIAQILSSSPSPGAIRDAVCCLHNIALSYLRHRAASSAFVSSRFGLELEDLALDLISGLFARDEFSRFHVLERYLIQVGWDTLSDQELSGAVRRLVCSRVSQELCRAYSNEDPILHRIIRNIKDSASSHSTIDLGERHGISWISFGEQATTEILPLAPQEYLGPYVDMFVAQSLSTKDILVEIGRLLRTQHIYEPGYPLVQLALLFRAAYSLHAPEDATNDEGVPSVNQQLENQDLDRQLVQSVDIVARRLRSTYVNKEKTTAVAFDAYTLAAIDILRAEYLSDVGEAESYFDHLSVHLPKLSLNRYRKEHRNILEYLVKLARKEFVEKVRDEA